MSGDAHSLQNCRGADKVLGGSDSHTPPPFSELLKEIPSVSEILEWERDTGACPKNLVMLSLKWNYELFWKNSA